MNIKIWLTCTIILALSAPAVSADVLEMPAPEAITPDEAAEDVSMPLEEAPSEVAEPLPTTAGEVLSVTLPGRGMTKDQVEDRFGAPREKVSPVGDPPISSWVYSGYTVYFEYDHVIHSVNHK